MAPGGGGKRKRGDRTFSQDSRDEGQRPSPHRPGDLSLGRQDGQQQAHPAQDQRRASFEQGGGGGRRGGRGGRGRGAQRSPINSPNNTHFQARQTPNSSIPKFPPILSPKTAPEHPPSAAPEPQPADSTMTQAPEEQPPQPPPYEYEIVTEDKISSWSEKGRQEIIDIGTEAVQNEDAMVLTSLFQELVHCGIYGRLDSEDAGSTVREILGRDEAAESAEPTKASSIQGFDVPSIFLDTISIMAEVALPLQSLPSLVAATGISAQKMRHELDSSLLENLGLVRKNIFVRVGIRQQTNLLYRQSNYNLLREETEGYAKLVTDLFTTSNNELPTNEVVEETFERVKGMIGAFDLDVGRVLDIGLDVFGSVLVKQYRFFIKYFRASSWWPQDNIKKEASSKVQLGPLPRWALPASVGRPFTDEEKMELSQARLERDTAFWERARKIGMPAFFELGGRYADEKDVEAAIAATNNSTTDPESRSRWIGITRTLPPPGSKVAAQILGFKLRFYHSAARDPSSAADDLPPNLIFLAALLIKIGFVSLQDLYPHLWPGEEGMESLKEERAKEKAERERERRPGGGVPNALALAKPLSDDPDPRDSRDPRESREAARQREAEAARRAKKVEAPAEKSTPVPQSDEKAEEPAKKPTSAQKVQLLKSLLTIGALPEALYMFGRFPWLVELFPDMPEYINRIIHHSLSKVYEPLRPMQDETNIQEQQHSTEEGAARGLQPLKLGGVPSRKRRRWAQLDQDNVNERDEVVDYRFYWDDWADMLPVCQDVDDVFTLCSTLLNLSGIRIGEDPALLIKLARIGISSLVSDNSPSNVTRWVDLSKRLLVPALSFTKSNPGVVNEVYELLKHFSYPTRYGIYAEWYSGQTSRLPEMKSQFELAKAETKSVLKRISKTNLKPMARALAKIAYANPGTVFAVAIAQLESYDNIIDVVVECARYFTSLAYDVLTWSLMNALSGQGRTRVQADGMLTSRWLAALSLFAGKVFKRYSVLTPTPIIQYVAEQLRKSNSTDLIVLEEIIKSMAGIVSDNTFNEAQVLAMSGGDLLQAQTLLQLLDKRHESKHTAKRLMVSLTDSKLAGKVLILVAQERQTCMFKIEEQDAHPKLLGNLFDQIHRIFIQYYDFLRSNLSVKDFNQYVPSAVQLVSEFGIDVGIAFWISRPSIVAAMAEYDANSSVQNSTAKEVAEIEPKSSEEGSDPMTQDPLDSAKDNQDEANDVEMQDSVEDGAALNKTTTADTESTLEPWHPVLKEIMDDFQPAMPSDTWKSMSTSFYITFWQCSLHDMFFPVQSYETEIQRQRKKIPALKADRSDVSVAGTQKKEREIKALEDLADRLQKESKERFQNYNLIRQRLKKEKEHWFSDFWGKADDLNLALVEQCFFPRLVLSPVDAMYTFKMLKYLHSSGATNFRTVGVYDQLFISQRLASMMFLCSAKEAENLGRFLHQLLADLAGWHKDKLRFEKEAYGNKKDLPGFAKRTTQDKQPITDFYEFEDFRRVLRKWHMNLTNALKTCLTSGEYMHIRNAINILNNIYQNFPAITFMGKQIVECVTKLSQTESRADLKLAAASLLGNLKRMEKNWVMPQAFNLVESGPNASNGGRNGSVKPSTPRPDDEANKSLNPKAADFQPSSTSNGKLSKTAPEIISSEDGEVDDVQMTDLQKQESFEKTVKAMRGPAADLTAEAKSRPASPKPTEKNPVSSQTTNFASKLKAEPSRGDVTKPPIPPKPEISRNTPARTQGLPARPEAPQVRVGDSRIPPRPNTLDRAAQEPYKDPNFPERPPIDRPRELRGRVERGPPPFQESDKPDTRSRSDRTQRLPAEGPPSTRSNADTRNSSNSYRDPRSYHEGPSPHSSSNHSSQNYNQGPNDREAAMPPPKANTTHNANTVNPERAALIRGRQENDHAQPVHQSDHRSNDGPRREDIPRSEHSSRGASPTRGPDRGSSSSFEGRRPDRKSEGYRTGPEAANARPRYEENYAPSGPRMDRSGGPPSSNPQSDRFRESMKPTAPSGPAFDPSHGRLSQDPPGRASRQSESQYGRLNAGNDIPSGPRMSNGNHPAPTRGGRNVSAPQPSQPSGPHHSPPAQSSNIGGNDKPTTNNPSTRGPGRDDISQTNQSPASNSVTNPTSQAPEAPSVHPDRLKAIQANSGPAPNSVHPDRLPAIEGSGPSHNRRASGPNRNEPNNRGLRQNPPPLSVPPAEASIRGTGPSASPVQQSPTNRGGPPPTGPSFSGDRNRDKRFAGLQGFLQQNGPSGPPERSNQGASIRGRGGRGMMPSSPSSSGPNQPNFPSTHDTNNNMSRDDPFASNRSNGPAPHPNPTDDNNSSSYNRGNGGGERRSNRHRSRSPNRDSTSDGPMTRQRDDPRPPPRENPRDRFKNDMAPPLGNNLRGGGGPPPALPPNMPEREPRGGGGGGGGGGRATRASARGEEGFEGRGGYDGRDGGGRDGGGGGGSMRKRTRGGEEMGGGGGGGNMDNKRPRR